MHALLSAMRLCSHLADCSGQALPATRPLLLNKKFNSNGKCSDFPLSLK